VCGDLCRLCDVFAHPSAIGKRGAPKLRAVLSHRTTEMETNRHALPKQVPPAEPGRPVKPARPSRPAPALEPSRSGPTTGPAPRKRKKPFALGFTVLALAGLIYSVFPQAGASRLARIHFWLHNIALPVMMGSRAMLLLGNASVVAALVASEFVAAAGVLVFACNVFINLKFYPHPAWLYLQSEAPRPMMDHPAVIAARRQHEEARQRAAMTAAAQVDASIH
jgi:hypothetical protein